jgi:hypothetical protein
MVSGPLLVEDPKPAGRMTQRDSVNLAKGSGARALTVSSTVVQYCHVHASLMECARRPNSDRPPWPIRLQALTARLVS